MSQAVENAALPATLLDEGTYLEPFGSHRGIQLYGVNKLLINIDGKWKVFNGELQGYEELDLSWLPVNGTRWSDVEKVSAISLRGADSKPGMVVPAAAT